MFLTIRVRNAPKRFSEKILVLGIFSLTVPKWPKMAQNGPKMVVNRKFLENGSNDFPDFGPVTQSPGPIRSLPLVVGSW